MSDRRALLVVLASVTVLVGASQRAYVQAANPLVLKYSVEEGMSGRQARGALFKAWIDEGKPVMATSDDEGRVQLNLGRPLSKGHTLFVEAESADGDRFYSWVYRDSSLSGDVNSSCQLVGLRDFRTSEIVTAERAQ